jgi:hypothetical protein
VLTAGPEPMVFPLQPFDGPVMVFGFVTENAPLGSRSTVTFDGVPGRATGLQVELFGEKPARFSRT